LKYKLEIICQNVLTFYQDKIKDFEVHIKTRADNGMLDTVLEIEAEKAKILEEIDNINNILKEAKENRGIGHIIILSYERGFQRGLASLTATIIS